LNGLKSDVMQDARHARFISHKNYLKAYLNILTYKLKLAIQTHGGQIVKRKLNYQMNCHETENI